MAAVHFGVLLSLVFVVSFSQVVVSRNVSALFAFGDSLVDAGNNNVLPTVSRANHPPYGIDFINHIPTGRFSNGRLVVDFIASLLGLPYPPAYHEAGSNILRGANFGSASSGILPQTHLQGALPLTAQINDFESLKRSLILRLGASEAQRLVSGSIFYICIANNDINNQLHVPGGVSPQYIEDVLYSFVRDLQRLYSLGARKFVIQGLSAVGCIPLNQIRGECNPVAQAVAGDYNRRLRAALASLRESLRGSAIVEANFYGLMVEVHSNPHAFGFSDATYACCPIRSSTVGCDRGTRYCPDRSQVVFWDAVHQTEAFNRIAATRWWQGSVNDVFPMNIKTLASL